MTSPTSDPAAAPGVTPPPLVDRVYGEPRFYTDGDVAALAVAADGTVWSVDETGVLRHWAADGKPLSRAYLSDLETLWAFDPKAKLLASGNDDLLLWTVATGQLATRLAQPAWVTAVGFAPAGTAVASGHDDGSIRIWDTTTHRLLREIAAHPESVSAIAFSPDGKHIATAGEDRAVKVFDAATGKLEGEYASHTDRIPGISWSADGSLFASAGWDTSARVWKPGSPDPVMLLNSHSDQVLALAFSPTGKLLATADSDHDIHLWADPVAATVGHVLRGHADEIKALAFSPDGTVLASAGADRVIHLWDVGTGKLVAGPNPSGRHALAAVPTPGKLLLASTGGPALRVWDAATGATVPPTGDGPAHSVAASADGRWLAVGGVDHFTRLYDLAAGTPPRLLEATKPPIGGLSFSPDGTRLAQTSPADGLVWIWKTAAAGDAELILIEAADGCTLEDVAFHPDGNRVLVGGIDYLSTGERTGAVVVWDLTTKLKATVFDVGVYAVAVDPTGRYAAGAGINDAVYVWDLDAGEDVFELPGHQGKVNAVAFSPDGSYLVSAGDDQTVRVWDVLSGRLVVVREFDAAVRAVAFDPDGPAVFTGNGNTTCYKLGFKTLLED